MYFDFIPRYRLPYCCRGPRSLSLPSVVQSAMRPNLSPLEYGAYGTPSKVVSVEVVGPHDGSDGSAANKSRRAAGAMVTIVLRLRDGEVVERKLTWEF